MARYAQSGLSCSYLESSASASAVIALSLSSGEDLCKRTGDCWLVHGTADWEYLVD